MVSDRPVPAPRPDAPAEPVGRPRGLGDLALTVLAVIASLWALQWAKPVLIPVLMGVLLSYAVAPAANLLKRWKVPRMAGAAVVLTVLLSLLGWGTWALSDQADELLETLPPMTAKLRQLLHGKASADSTLRKVERAVAELEAAATSGPSPAATGAPAAASQAPAGRAGSPPQAAGGRTPTPAPAAAPRFDLRGYLLSGSVGVLVLLGQLTAMVFIALFLVAAGTGFRRKMVRIAGPRLSRKKVTVETLNEINDRIQRYLLLQAAMSVLVGVATWLAFAAIGLEQAAVWGVVAAVTNLVPYLGAVFVGLSASAVAFAQFGSLEMAALVCAVSFGIRTINGNLLSPWLLGRAGRIDPVVVFVTLLLFGWLWGAWGLVLGVPILMVIKTTCERVEELHAVSELLSH